ncbi:MAG: GNAT family protein [Candidatus Nomurabacteria bacterium]
MNRISLKTVLGDKNLSLRPLPSQTINLDYLANMADDYEIAKYVGPRFPNPYTRKDSSDFLNFSRESWNSGKEYNFGIFIQKGKYIGNIGIVPDYDNNIISNLGYWLSKKYEGNGYMTRSVFLMTEFIFNNLNFRKIEANVYEGNIGSTFVLKKNGFSEEGILKSHVRLIDGTILDKILFGKINPNNSF